MLLFAHFPTARSWLALRQQTLAFLQLGEQRKLGNYWHPIYCTYQSVNVLWMRFNLEPPSPRFPFFATSIQLGRCCHVWWQSQAIYVTRQPVVKCWWVGERKTHPPGASKWQEKLPVFVWLGERKLGWYCVVTLSRSKLGRARPLRRIGENPHGPPNNLMPFVQQASPVMCFCEQWRLSQPCRGDTCVIL